MSAGYVYILTNTSLRDDYLKIGQTTNQPKDRASQISSVTGVASPYQVAYFEAVPDCETAERRVHRKLAPERVRDNREFFQITVDKARSVVASVAAEVRAERPICRDCSARKSVDELQEERTRLHEQLKETQEKLAQAESRASNLAASLRSKRLQALRAGARKVAHCFARLVSSPYYTMERFLARFIRRKAERVVCAAGFTCLALAVLLVLCLLFAPASVGVALTLSLVSIASLLVITDPQLPTSEKHA